MDCSAFLPSFIYKLPLWRRETYAHCLLSIYMTVQFQCAYTATSELVIFTLWPQLYQREDSAYVQFLLHLPLQTPFISVVTYVGTFSLHSLQWDYFIHLQYDQIDLVLFSRFLSFFNPFVLLWVFSPDLCSSSLIHSSAGFTVLLRTFIGFLILMIILFS